MNLLDAGPAGVQSPRVEVLPDVSWSEADDAAFLSSSYGLAPDDWQARILRGWLGRSDDGRWSARRCGLAVPRQNGKNGVIEIRELFGMVVLGERFLHTAHEVKTARKAFLRLCSFFENPKFPELASMVVEVRRTNGQEAILLNNGGAVEFVARSRGSARGFTVDVLVLDEAQELTDEQMEALMPTLSAAPLQNPQILLAGTPPPPGSPGEVFRRIRDEAHDAVPGGRLCWHEWGIESADVDPADRAVWAATNPALGIRIFEESIEDELATLSWDGFLRERLGLWAEIGADAVPPAFDLDRWAAGVVDEAPEGGQPVYGVKFSVDGSVVALAAAVKPESGPVHVEGIDQAELASPSSFSSLVAWLAARDGQIVVDGKGYVDAFVKDLVAAGVQRRRIRRMSVADVIAAAAGLQQAILAGAVSHLDDEALALDDVVRREIGKQGGWGLAGRHGEDVSLVEAVMLAHWGASTLRGGGGRSGGRRKAVVM